MHELSEALESAADGAFIVNEDLQIVHANRRSRELLGIRIDGGPKPYCYQALQGRDDQEQLICRQYCQVARMVNSGSPVPNFDLRVSTGSDGDRWINMSVFRHRSDDDGSYTVHLFRDITQAKLEAQLVENLVDVARRYHNIETTSVTPRDSVNRVDGLTPREREVLHLLARGDSTKEIAAGLSIAVSTSRNHIQNILEKLDVHSRVEAVVLAINTGLIDNTNGPQP